MSGREWKPGDVAAAKRHDGSECRAIFRADETWRLAEACVNNPPREFRPLVVIDPEDREQVERFREIASRWADQVPYSDMREPGDMDHTDAMQAALREFANPTPPKPEEPTGLGAVVEDASKCPYTRFTSENVKHPWVDEAGCSYAWSEFPAVRVLSEGVQA